jgi:hypothetical protein
MGPVSYRGPMPDPIQHTVAFSLRYPAESPEEADFFTAASVLATIPGVEEFKQFRQVSPKSTYSYCFSMWFADDAAYESYNNHPAHTAFVRDRWEADVSDFQELDFVALTRSG